MKNPSLASVLSSATVCEFEGRPEQDIDLLLWLGGDYSRDDLRESAAQTLAVVREQFSDWHVTLLIDGPEWAVMASPLSCGRIIQLSQATSLPQALFVLALRSSKFPWVAFAWPGSHPAAEALLALRGIAGDVDLAYAENVVSIPAGVGHPVQHGRLRMFDAIPMECCVLATKSAALLPFDSSPLLQRLFWRDFVIRLSKHGRLTSLACASASRASQFWNDYPFSHPVPVDVDMAARYVHAGNDLQAFLTDTEGSGTAAGCEAWSVSTGLSSELPKIPPSSRRGWPIRVLVLGGIYESPNNELCFLRPFEKIRGQGYLTWRTKLYERCTAEDLRHNDLVIFGRPRYPGCDALMRECKSLGVGTIVMIDDNWIVLGREMERYRFLFGPGQPQMETFLECMRLADFTIVYNRMVAEDVAPYAREVVQLEPYVDPAAYAHERGEWTGGLLVGFSGSERPDTPAFPALADFARRHEDVDVLFFGPPLPPALQAIDPKRVHSASYEFNYEAYAKRISELQPDILLAPLDDCRGWGSKVPNKFLEISTLGAAGIYSRVEPYLSYVRDGETGLLVDNTDRGWSEALERLYSDGRLRSSIAARAHQVVSACFSIDQAIPRLLELFERATR